MFHSFLYFPEKTFAATPKEVGLDFAEHFIKTTSGRTIHDWFLLHPQASATLLFFHGNAGNISHRLDKLKIFHEIGLATLIIDYAGYGKSEGKPSEPNLYEDGEAAYHYALQHLKINPKKLFLYGESLGSAVAIELAGHQPTAGIILEGAFATLKELSKQHMPFLTPLAGDQYNNLAKITKLQTPILFIHSKQDEICSFEQALKLYEAAPSPKEYLWLETGGHNDAFWLNAKRYSETIQKFVEEAK